MSVDKTVVLGVMKDTMADFLYYNRKGDQDLKVGEIEEAIANGAVTIEELCDVVRTELYKAIK